MVLMGSFVIDDVVHSSVELHSEPHVLLDGKHVTKPTHRPLQGVEPSYESTYQEVHNAKFEQLHTFV